MEGDAPFDWGDFVNFDAFGDESAGLAVEGGQVE